MKEWNFKVFISSEGENEVNDWIESLSNNNEIRARNTIAHLETQKDMNGPYFGKWKGHKYLYRLKFNFNKEKYRIFGFYGLGGNEFTLLIPAPKVAGRLVPSNVVEIAEKRYEMLQENGGLIDDFV